MAELVWIFRGLSGRLNEFSVDTAVHDLTQTGGKPEFYTLTRIDDLTIDIYSHSTRQTYRWTAEVRLSEGEST